MSPFMIRVMLWAVIAGVICYAFNISPAHIFSAIFQALHQMHQASNGH